MGIEQIPFLLQLLDDESPVVRAEVENALRALGDELPGGLERYDATQAQREDLQERLLDWRCRRLVERWPRQWEASPDYARLETAQSLISDFFQGFCGGVRLSEELDRLAADYPGPREPEALARHLFTARLSGDSVDYYLPLNSSLVHVLARGRGNPISLCCVFMLVGHRLGLSIEGSNAPGHFLAWSEGRFYDCFRQGQLLEEAQEHRPCTGLEVMIRVLRNLVGAYQRQEKRAYTQLFGYLLSDLQSRSPGEPPRAAWPEPTFAQGALVRQRGGDYRGVVVHYALRPEGPRYYVLVHRSSRWAEATEDELLADDSGPVAHSLVNYFFSKFEGGCYYRNGRPWEG